VLSLFPSISLGVYDVQGNQVPEGYNISVIPTLLFFPANNKNNPITFTGDREKTSLVHFILQHQTTLDADTVKEFKTIISSTDTEGDLNTDLVENTVDEE